MNEKPELMEGEVDASGGEPLKVCALIPAFNEASRVTRVVSLAKNYVDQVVVIDDGSEDDTGELATAAGAVCLRSEVHGGKGSALRKGIEHIPRDGYTHVLFMDADGQHRPDDIPNLVQAAIETRADMVIGIRQFDRKRMPTPRYFSNTVGSIIASWLVGSKIKDSQCGFRLVRLDKLRQLDLSAKRYEFEMEVLIKMSLIGGKLAYAPVSTVYEEGKAHSKMQPVRDTVRICFASLFYRFLGR